MARLIDGSMPHFLQAQVQARVSYDEKWPTYNFPNLNKVKNKQKQIRISISFYSNWAWEGR